MKLLQKNWDYFDPGPDPCLDPITVDLGPLDTSIETGTQIMSRPYFDTWTWEKGVPVSLCS